MFRSKSFVAWFKFFSNVIFVSKTAVRNVGSVLTKPSANTPFIYCNFSMCFLS